IARLLASALARLVGYWQNPSVEASSINREQQDTLPAAARIPRQLTSPHAASRPHCQPMAFMLFNSYIGQVQRTPGTKSLLTPSVTKSALVVGLWLAAAFGPACAQSGPSEG